MSLEQPNTLDRHDTMPSYQMNEVPPPGKRSSYGWIWIVLLVLVGVGYYYFRSHANTAKAASGSAQGSGGMPGRGSGAIPVVDAIARKGDIGVYYTGLGAVTPIYT